MTEQKYGTSLSDARIDPAVTPDPSGRPVEQFHFVPSHKLELPFRPARPLTRLRRKMTRTLCRLFGHDWIPVTPCGPLVRRQRLCACGVTELDLGRGFYADNPLAHPAGTAAMLRHCRVDAERTNP